MSRNTIYRSAAIAGAALALSACAESWLPTSTLARDGTLANAATELSAAPSSIEWQAEARRLVGVHNMSALAAARVYAALGVAQYRAVMSATDSPADGELPVNGIGAGGRAALEANRGAVAGASASVLAFLFPNFAQDQEQRVAAIGNAGPGNVHPQFERGLALGRAAGDAMVARLKADKFTTPWTGTVPTGPGMWIANGTPAGGTFGGVTPYLMTSGSQFRSAPPPAWQSAAFDGDMAEVRTLSDNRTAAQREIAIQWNYGNGTYTPPGYWNLVTSDLAGAYRLNERAATHAFALTGAAMMDALIGCWDAKYFYWTIRPWQADNGITLTFGAPNHPSYPSGHSCVSAAAATVIGHLFPEEAAEVNARVIEAGMSRIYAGIHYRFDITAGQDLGRAVASLAIDLDSSVGLIQALR
jgi:membrane-associated phospholipid phosphatase